MDCEEKLRVMDLMERMREKKEKMSSEIKTLQQQNERLKALCAELQAKLKNAEAEKMQILAEKDSLENKLKDSDYINLLDDGK